MKDFFPHLQDACLYRGDPYRRIDPFFAHRLGLEPGVQPPKELPDNFMDSPGCWSLPAAVSCESVSIDGEGSGIPANLYRRKSQDDGASNSWMLWMHGGGFVEGDMTWAEAHAVCADLTERTGITCVSIDYRLVDGQKNLYPAAIEDVLAAWKWMVAQAEKGQGESKLFIGGASAGANLASALCLKARDCPEEVRRPDGFLSAYGVFHALRCPQVNGWSCNTDILPEPLRVGADEFRAFQIRYVGGDSRVPRYSAAGEADLAGFPPTVLVCAEFDDLAQSSIAFAAKLQQAGVEVRSRMALGALHGFLNWYPVKELPQTLETEAFFAHFIQDIERRGGLVSENIR